MLALLMLVLRRSIAERRIPAITRMLRIAYGSKFEVEEQDFTLKYKYDEVSMRLRVWSGKSFEVATAKLLQVVVIWGCMWRIGNKFILVRFPMPSSLRAIEKCSVRNMRGALNQHALMPPCSKSFSAKTRLPISDRHVSNTAADCSFAQDYVHENLQKYNCQAHI